MSLQNKDKTQTTAKKLFQRKANLILVNFSEQIIIRLVFLQELRLVRYTPS